MNFAQKLLAFCVSLCLSAFTAITPINAVSSPCTGNGPDLHGQTITPEIIKRYGSKINDGWTDIWTIDLSNANLAGATFAIANTYVKNSNYSCANLTGATISWTGNQPNFEFANLASARLNGIGYQANFKNANLSGAFVNLMSSQQNYDFTNANLNNTKFFDSQTNNDSLWINGKFINTDLRTIIVPNPEKLNLNGDYTGSNMSGMHIYSLYGNYTNTNLSETQIQVIGGNFTGANLANSTIGSKDAFSLSGSNFTNANLSNTTITGKKICILPHSQDSLALYEDAGYKVTFNNSNLDSLNLSGLSCMNSTGQKNTSFPLMNFDGRQILGSPNLPNGYQIINGILFGPGVQITDLDLGVSDLSNLDLTGAFGKGLKGSPKLPSGWKIIAGNLVGPGAFLLNQDFAGADLSRLDLSYVKSFGLTRIGKLPTGYKLIGGTVFGPRVDLSGLRLNEWNEQGILISTDYSHLNLQSADLSWMYVGQYSGAVDFSHTDFSRANFLGAQIPTDTDFSEANLSFVDLTASLISASPDHPTYSHSLAKFSGANFTGANLAGFDLGTDNFGSFNLTANFSQANLSGTSLQNHDYSSSTFSKANLSNANLSNANLQGANFDQAILTGIKSGLIQGQPLNLNESWSQMGGYLVGPSANLSHADLSNTTLSNLNLTGTRLNYADLSGSDLTNTNLSSANLNFANLISTNLQSANLAQAHMDYADLDSANLSGANLTSAIMFGTNLTNAMFASTSVPSTFISSSSGLRSGPSFAKKVMRTIPAANLTNANISNSDIRRANFSGANLVGATFFKSNTSLAKFTGSIWGNTVCADGTTSNQRTGSTCLGALLLTTKFAQTKVGLPTSLKKSAVINLPAVTTQNRPLTMRVSGGCAIAGVYNMVNGKRVLSFYKLTAKKTIGSCTVTASATANTYYASLTQSQIVSITN